MINQLEIERRVERGAALLDEKRPGWWQRCDLKQLHLRDACKCVLGLEYGNYYVAADILGIGPGENYGFDAGDYLPKAVDGLFRWDLLAAAWKRLILARRSESQPTLPCTDPYAQQEYALAK